MRIAQISDTHILAKSADRAVGASRADDLRRCVADINRQGVDAVLHTGDSVHHGMAEEYAHLREILAELQAPLFLIPGNRDGHAALRAAFNDLSYLPRDGDLLHYAVEDYPVRLSPRFGCAGRTQGRVRRAAARLAGRDARSGTRQAGDFLHPPPAVRYPSGLCGRVPAPTGGRGSGGGGQPSSAGRAAPLRPRPLVAPRDVGRHGRHHHAQRCGGPAQGGRSGARRGALVFLHTISSGRRSGHQCGPCPTDRAQPRISDLVHKYRVGATAGKVRTPRKRPFVRN